MRFVRTLFLFTVACGSNNGGDTDSFDTFQACYTEHHTTESFDSACAIEICCIDHPIGGATMNTVCGASATTCDTYVTANLADPNDANLGSDISSACTFYVVDSGRGSGTGSTCGS
jgi:hypothetical protein